MPYVVVFALLSLAVQANPVAQEPVDGLSSTVLLTSSSSSASTLDVATSATRTDEEPRRPPTTMPTFAVERLDAPIERIEIRLIDENNTAPRENDVIDVSPVEGSTSSPTEPVVTSTKPDDWTGGDTTTTITPPAGEATLGEVTKYKKVEYVVQPTNLPNTTLEAQVNDESDPPTTTQVYVVEGANESTPAPTQSSSTSSPFSELSAASMSDVVIVVGDTPDYFTSTSTSSSSTSPTVTLISAAQIQAKAWLSVSSVPKFDGDIDEDDLPPPPADSSTQDEREPEEECLANSAHLSEAVVQRLKAETAMYHRLVRQRNEQQREYCSDATVAGAHRMNDEYRRCADWRAEKLVYYYKLMRKTYCQVDHWPNPTKAKQTYGEYLNLFGTFYAFQN